MSAFELQMVRHAIAIIWLITGILSMGIYPIEDSLQMVAPLGLPRSISLVLVYGAAALDILMGILTWTMPRARLWLAQMTLIICYSLLATYAVPEQWLHPFAPLLKNLAVLALLWLLYRHDSSVARR